LLEIVIARCCRLKADVVEQDEREETGLRAVLNYGHTFAHAFEAVGGYGRWRHGEAVAAGMVCASQLAEQLGLVTQEVTEQQIRLLRALGLPVAPPADWSVAAVIEAMYRDKKAVAGRLRFVLPTAIGRVKVVEDVPDELVREVLRP
jgi:3-dehydroquinate synthase